MFDWSLNMKRSLSTGGQASVGRLLAEAEDYSHVKRNVNGYFELMKKLPRMTWINAEYKFYSALVRVFGASNQLAQLMEPVRGNRNNFRNAEGNGIPKQPDNYRHSFCLRG
jgi:hypothetical protein